MRSGLFAPTAEGEARLLLLIDAFSKNGGHLQGRVKLAKLDFLLRYPVFFARAMEARGRPSRPVEPDDQPTIEQRMIRYRYGPWDPAYYAILGSLIGRGLVITTPEPRYLGLRVTEAGHDLAAALAASDAWSPVAKNAQELRTTFRDQQGTWLKNFIYSTFPEVAGSSWGQRL
ncbi:MAG: hypothetical protein JWP32_2665 [Schumannella sp.]|nr:hypothetical protein [Schumannella sp.]